MRVTDWDAGKWEPILDRELLMGLRASRLFVNIAGWPLLIRSVTASSALTPRRPTSRI
jgi:hypothetical protein